MWTFRVVVSDPCSIDVVELVNTEADEMIQAFSFQGSDERFTEGIGFGSFHRSLDATDVLGSPEFLKVVREFTITVVDEKSGIQAFIIQPHSSISTLLHDPCRIRMQRGMGAVDLTAADVDEDQAIGRVGSTERVDFLSRAYSAQVQQL